MQSPLAILYPPACVSCGEPVEDDHGLCGKCWAETPFITGHVCDKCGSPLLGEEDGALDLCDDCMTWPRPWSRGRSALLFKDNARRMVLAMKLQDRLDLVPAAAVWLARAGRDIIRHDTIIVPIPAHWTRTFTRQYNQAAELARALGRAASVDVAPTALIRPRRTEDQEGKGFDGRFANLMDAIKPHPKKGKLLVDRPVLIVDDVMTSGATFAAAAEACKRAGARDIVTLALARMVKDA